MLALYSPPIGLHTCDTRSSHAGSDKDRLREALLLPETKPGRQKAQKASKQAQKRQGMVILVLDELDRLLAQDQTVLQDLFLLTQVIKALAEYCLSPMLSYLDTGKERQPFGPMTQHQLIQVQALGFRAYFKF